MTVVAPQRTSPNSSQAIPHQRVAGDPIFRQHEANDD